jgi:hypothetical protein
MGLWVRLCCYATHKHTINSWVASVTLFALQVQWKPLMDEVFATNFTDSDMFYVVAPDYMESLQQMLTHFENRYLQMLYEFMSFFSVLNL